MREYSRLHKEAWEFDAYNFWNEHSGTPAERAKEDVKNPRKKAEVILAAYNSIQAALRMMKENDKPTMISLLLLKESVKTITLTQ